MLRTIEVHPAYDILIKPGISAETARLALEKKPQLNEILQIMQDSMLFTEQHEHNSV
jgi:hypothetical protein